MAKKQPQPPKPAPDFITIAAIPNAKFTSWTVSCFPTGGGSHYHLTGAMPRRDAEIKAEAVRAILGLKAPLKGSYFDYSESPG